MTNGKLTKLKSLQTRRDSKSVSCAHDAKYSMPLYKTVMLIQKTLTGRQENLRKRCYHNGFYGEGEIGYL